MKSCHKLLMYSCLMLGGWDGNRSSTFLFTSNVDDDLAVLTCVPAYFPSLPAVWEKQQKHFPSIVQGNNKKNKTKHWDIFMIGQMCLAAFVWAHRVVPLNFQTRRSRRTKLMWCESTFFFWSTPLIDVTHAHYMHYLLVVVSRFLSVYCWHRGVIYHKRT